MSVHKAYKFRLYPNSEQKALLAQTFGCCRFVYNHFLSERTKYYETHKDDTKKSLNYCDTSKLLTAMKKNEATLWLKDAPSQAVQRSIRNLDDAFKRFFKKQADFPAFKRRSNNQSCSFPQGFSLSLDGKTITLPKLGKVKLVYHREIPSDAKFCYATVSKTCSGQYYVSLTVEEKELPLPLVKGSVGVDLGLIDVVTLSNGFKSGNPKKRRRLAKKLAFQQRQHARKKKASRRREKARIRVAKTYAKTARQSSNFNHKLSRSIVDENQVIVVESLDINGMLKNRRLARSIGEVAWGELIRQLEYKSQWAGRSFVRIGQFFPSSKTCNHCGAKRTLKLEERLWECECGAVNDRDANASHNILEEGLRVLNERILSDSVKTEKDSSGEGLPSDVAKPRAKAIGRANKQKLREASQRVLPQGKKSGRVYELRCPRFQSGE